MKIEGVVVLYNSSKNVLENVKSYIKDVEKLYIVDNSEDKNTTLINEIKTISQKCIYIDNNCNQGIAHALNIGADLAIQNGADWLLTMDQDGSFRNGDFTVLVEGLKEIDLQSVAIITPKHYEFEEKINIFYNSITMTSGNLINLKIYEILSGFDDKLFIDSVDTDYCLKIYRQGYKIKRLSSMTINHNLGEIKNYNFFGFKFNPTNHSYIRRYYITRNRFYLWSKYKNIYPEFIKWEKKATFKELIKIILFEKEKWLKIKFSIKGYLDYKNNKFGKYEKE